MDIGWEIAFGVGALILLTALIFGVLQYHYRDRRAVQAGEDIVRDRYKRDAS
ncbi:hypothetical protein JQ615_18695 [Bradyrhizobium jicamae]|uniref:Uncharacterized protein n=1 Tax=Bradyrhizobium jicamae TaxID=280332 RepID=A0ABS5FKW1_9BRAD|nr:hypothetical protein [Bradyrhizobium jicamae]MBR0797420.1 hypothetical protein [Bradyrhizobium jicamae]MBR0939012.1 hypothetical protein [Bradyrhizobium jicamae]